MTDAVDKHFAEGAYAVVFLADGMRLHRLIRQIAT